MKHSQKNSVSLYKTISQFSIEEFKKLLPIANQQSLNEALYQASKEEYDTREYVSLLISEGAWVGYLTLKNAFDQKHNKYNPNSQNKYQTNYEMILEHLAKNPKQMNFPTLNFLFEEHVEFFRNKKCTFSEKNLFYIINIRPKSLEKSVLKNEIIKSLLQQAVPNENTKLEYFDNGVKNYVVQARIIDRLFKEKKLVGAAKILEKIIAKAAEIDNSEFNYEIIIGRFNAKIKEIYLKKNQNAVIKLLKDMEENGFFESSIKLDKNLGTILYENSLLKIIWQDFSTYKNDKIIPLKFMALTKVINNNDWQALKKSDEINKLNNAEAIDRIAELFNVLELDCTISNILDLYKLPMKKLPILCANSDDILKLYPQNPVIGAVESITQDDLQYSF